MCNVSNAPATCQMPCCVQRSAIKFDRVQIAFIFALFCLLKPLTDEGGKETRVPRETPDDELQKSTTITQLMLLSTFEVIKAGSLEFNMISNVTVAQVY